MPTHATSDEAFQWLHSVDPRMVAWGATFAAKNHDTSMVPYLQRLAEEWVPQPTGYNPDGSALVKTEPEKASSREMSCVLDALIQMHGMVSPETIQRLVTNFTGQALTLFAYMPEPERRAFAESVYAGRQLGAEYWSPIDDELTHRKHPPLLPGFENNLEQFAAGELIHMAAAILANDPPPGFAASLLNETTVPLQIWVSDQGLQRPIMLGAHGYFLTPVQPKGWPEEWTYVVEEKWPARAAADLPKSSDGCPACCVAVRLAGELDAGDEVIVPGVPALTTRRSEIPDGSGFGVFTSDDRLQLLHAMIGDMSRKLGGRLQETENVNFMDDAAFQLAVQGGVAKREQEFQSLSKELVAKGLMTVAEAQNALPTLQIYVADSRQTKIQPLPEIKLQQQSNKVVVVYSGK